jgi:hypothetical protein
MQLHPDLRKKWDHLNRDGAHLRLFDEAKFLALPFWWHGPTKDDGDILHNGTICKVETSARILGVTADHVYAEYLKDRATGKLLVCQFGDITVAPEERLIDRDEVLDLATFELTDIIGNRPRFVANSWPPGRPEVSEPVIYGGFPGYSRAADLEAATATFLFESVTGLIGDLSAQSIVMSVNYSKLWDADMPEGTISSIHPGGVSGGPVCRIDDVNTPFRIELVGFIYEQNDEYRCALARHADLIRADGTILHPR